MNATIQLPVIKITASAGKGVTDVLAIEEPLEIRIEHGAGSIRKLQNLAVTMRTPGNDNELALGFLFTEGIINDRSSVDGIDHVYLACSENRQNVIKVSLKEHVIPYLLSADRNFYTTSSCGVCGKASIGAIRTIISFIHPQGDSKPLNPSLFFSLPDMLAPQQRVFADTGGLHAAALFSNEGELMLIREDVGRHNALDKLIGASLMQGIVGLNQMILLLSGRVSFELVQKAAMAGIPVIAAIGAPSSLAVELAEEFGITLIGFVRNNRFNIYTVAHRINFPFHENTN